ncbi:hypothetical protein FGO68_gene13575 [Halteria grandinella]|uniref:Uncharacterized protein n=1 Tax=Halteria grandinella TaxID=5974 RepID=A0A8J8T674_HALGN|nr:hypothetical protein FGO68_gene13575 [Halteria grandinella]
MFHGKKKKWMLVGKVDGATNVIAVFDPKIPIAFEDEKTQTVQNVHLFIVTDSKIVLCLKGNVQVKLPSVENTKIVFSVTVVTAHSQSWQVNLASNIGLYSVI